MGSVVEMEFGKCWEVHKVRLNIRSNSCWKNLKRTFFHLFLNTEMKLINTDFGLLKHFSIKTDLLSSHSVTGIHYFFLMESKLILVLSFNFSVKETISARLELLVTYCLHHCLDKNKDLHSFARQIFLCPSQWPQWDVFNPLCCYYVT